MAKLVAKEKVRITDSWVEKQEYCDTGRRIVYDSDLTGFCMRISANRKVFAVRVKVIEAGRFVEKNYTLGRYNDPLNTASARKQAALLIGNLKSGTDPIKEQRAAAKVAAEERRGALTISEALTVFLADRIAMAERTKRDYEYLMTHELAPYANTQLQDVDLDWARRVNAEIAKATVKKGNPPRVARATKALKLVQTLCRYNGKGLLDWTGVTWHEYIPKDPVLEASDGTTIWNALENTHVKSAAAYMQFLLLSGCRRGELAKVLVGDVNLRTREMVLVKTKNGSNHVIYLSDQMVEAIKPLLTYTDEDGIQHKRDPGDFLFHGAGDPRKTLHLCQKAVGKRFGYHELRKMFAQTANKLGITLPVLKGCLNHNMKKSSDVTMAVYSHASSDDKRIAWQKISDHYTGRSGNITSLNEIRGIAA